MKEKSRRDWRRALLPHIFGRNPSLGLSNMYARGDPPSFGQSSSEGRCGVDFWLDLSDVVRGAAAPPFLRRWSTTRAILIAAVAALLAPDVFYSFALFLA